MDQKPTTIFINPKFKNAHFNPNFVPNNKIHVNPKFLQKRMTSVDTGAPLQSMPIPLPQSIHQTNAIIRNTRRTLIRAPEAPRSNDFIDKIEVKKFTSQPQQQLIKISKNKLVTAAHLMKCQQKENEIIKKTTESIIKSKNLQRKNNTKDSIYKLDRRFSPQKKKKRIVSTYSIRRVDADKSGVNKSPKM